MRYGENVRLSTERRMSGGCADGDSGGENYFHFRCEQFEMTVGYARRIVMLVVTVLVLESTGAFSTTKFLAKMSQTHSLIHLATTKLACLSF